MFSKSEYHLSCYDWLGRSTLDADWSYILRVKKISASYMRLYAHIYILRVKKISASYMRLYALKYALIRRIAFNVIILNFIVL